MFNNGLSIRETAIEENRDDHHFGRGGIGCRHQSCLFSGAPKGSDSGSGESGRIWRYTGEILRAEGFNEFQVESPSASGLTVSYLNQFNVVILTETKLTSAQAELFSSYVHGGGNLIAFRPDKQLAPVFGISDTGTRIAEGYIKIERGNDIGKGLASDTLQFHGDSDQYDLKGGNVVATLYSDADTSTGKPAVVSHEFGDRACRRVYLQPAQEHRSHSSGQSAIRWPRKRRDQGNQGD